MSLYAITTELMGLLDAITESADSPEAQAAIAEHTALLVAAMNTKSDDYAALITTCAKRAEARREEAARMKALADADDALADRLTRMLMDAMVSVDRKTINTSRFKLTIKKNGGKIPVVITDEAALPVDFRVPKVTEVIDKDGIREALEAGTPVPGAELGQRGQRLEIK